MIRLIVKGKFADAFWSAAAYGIAFQLRNEIPPKDGCETYSVGFAEMKDLEKVARWFTKDIASEPGKGFPIGSLLHYSFT